MNKSVLLLTIAAVACGVQFSAQAGDVRDDSNLSQVAAVIPVESDFEDSELDLRYVKCDYNFLGRIVIRDGQFYLGLQGEFVLGEGLRINAVEPNSPAAKAGLVRGMLITSLNGERPDNRSGFDNSFEKFDGIVKLSCQTSEDSQARNLKLDLRQNFIAAR